MCRLVISQLIYNVNYVHCFRFHILTPMYTGFTNTVNSLYNVKKMVFTENNVATLEMLKMALMNNWGEK